MYVTAQNQDAHISMVIEDQNFMEYTITSGFYSGGPWVYFVEHGKYKVVSIDKGYRVCLLYTSPSPRDRTRSRMPSSA